MSLPNDDVGTLREMLVTIKKNLHFIADRYETELAPYWLDWKPMKYWEKFIEEKFKEADVMLSDAAANEKVSTALENHGLTGALLKSKSDFLKSATSKVHEHFKSYPETLGGTPKPVKRKMLSWLLNVLDVFLDSFAAALPPLGVVTEFKKTIETEFKETNADHAALM